MNVYTIYADQQGICHAVKQGWSWPAFFFTFLWAFAKKRWVMGSCALALVILVRLVVGYSAVETVNILTMVISQLPIFALVVFFGMNGNQWLENHYIAKGFINKQTFPANSAKGALEEYRKLNEANTSDAQTVIRADSPEENDSQTSEADPAGPLDDEDQDFFLEGLRPLGNRKRLTHTDNHYDAQLFLFADKKDCKFYYDLLVLKAMASPPPFCVEIMYVNIHTIYKEPYGIAFPHAGTDTRPEYGQWMKEVILDCNEAGVEYQPFAHSYGLFHQYVEEVYRWTILTPEPFDHQSPEAKEIFSDPPDGGYRPMLEKTL